MFVKRLTLLTLLALALVLTIGLIQAGAATPSRVLKFYDAPATQTAVGFNENADTPPPVGASQIIKLVLENSGSQFGKASGAKVGRVLLDCTIMAVNPSAQMVDGNCNGIAHVPDGFFTFEGNGGLTGATVAHYAVTGGVGAYADARGQITVKNSSNGSSVATVTLYG